MASSLFEELKLYVGFTQADEENLRFLAGPLGPRIPGIVRELYRQLEDHPTSRSALRESGTSPARVRATIRDWLSGLLVGPYDEEYYSRRSRMGQVHVRLRMPQHVMVGAISLVRVALISELRALGLDRQTGRIDSLNKIIDLEIAIALEAFREAYTERVRQSERRAMKDLLKESEHLASVGQLAAALAHEIKNPLAGISGAIQVIASALAPDDPHREIVDEILMQIDRLDATVRDLLVYARPKPPERMMQRVGGVVERALVLLRQEPALQNVTVRCEGLDCETEALIDDAQIQQVITNLLLNAADACEKGGEVSVRISSRNGLVRIEVADQGTGMSASEAERAFEPFFTTKSRGTGLGLPICKRIIEAHDGRITLESQLGKGTGVLIELPGEL
jgi:signal transduction histidine kinase